MKIKFKESPKGRPEFKAGDIKEFKGAVEEGYALKYITRGWAEPHDDSAQKAADKAARDAAEKAEAEAKAKVEDQAKTKAEAEARAKAMGSQGGDTTRR